jgi:hypothetical protein
MTRYEIARMAREAGLAIDTSDRMSTSRETHFWVEGCYFDIERFFKLAYEAGAAAEREKVAAWMRQRDEWVRDRLARHGIPFPGEENGRDPV